MCGSGTILIEAGQIASGIAPGSRRYFAFQNWSDFDTTLWQDTKKAAAEQQGPVAIPLIGTDKNFKAIRVAQQNAAAAGLDGQITFQRMNYQRYQREHAEGMIITNPPYGLRVEDTEDMLAFYQELGDKFKRDFSGYTAWVLSGNMDALKRLGLRPSRKIALMNGQLPCKFQRYDSYEGSKR